MTKQDDKSQFNNQISVDEILCRIQQKVTAQLTKRPKTISKF